MELKSIEEIEESADPEGVAGGAAGYLRCYYLSR